MPQFSGEWENKMSIETLARLQAWEADMVKRYNAYCELHNLTPCSADELEFAIQCMETTPPELQDAHLAFLSAFIAEWERWEDESAAYWGDGSYAGTSAEDYV